MRSFLLGKLAMLFLSTYTLLAKDSFALIVLELFLTGSGQRFVVFCSQHLPSQVCLEIR
jgi:hypothetical protein